MNTKPLILIVAIMAVVLTGCTVDKYGLRNPEVEARAAAVQNDAYIKKQKAEADLAIRKANSDAEVAAKAAELEALRLKAVAEADGARAIGQAKAEAERSTIAARGEAISASLRALGTGGYLAIVAFGVGIAISIIIIATGRSVAYTYNAILTAQYVRIGVEPVTMLPPPLVITVDGFLIDTRSGERSRIRDAAGVNRMRLAATTQTTNAALLGRAAVDISKANRGKEGNGVQAADALPTIASSIPLLQEQ